MHKYEAFWLDFQSAFSSVFGFVWDTTFSAWLTQWPPQTQTTPNEDRMWQWHKQTTRPQQTPGQLPHLAFSLPPAYFTASFPCPSFLSFALASYCITSSVEFSYFGCTLNDPICLYFLILVFSHDQQMQKTKILRQPSTSKGLSAKVFMINNPRTSICRA